MKKFLGMKTIACVMATLSIVMAPINTNEVQAASLKTNVPSIGSEIGEAEFADSLGEEVAAYAQQFVGNPYVYGGTSLTNGTDCSGFTMSVYKKFGISLSRTSRTQVYDGKSVTPNSKSLQEGDLLFYTSGGSINHVALYIGSGKIVHASNRKDGIKISNYNYRTPYKAVRIVK